MGHPASEHSEREIVVKALPAVVQIVALRKGFLGNLSSAWTGSGSIIHPSGIVLTNCHVANPRAMGMPAPPADRLAIAVTDRSDEAPALTYIAEIIAQSPELDLAILKIVSGFDGRSTGQLNLPYLPLGDSDSLELGDHLTILGYPGIGGETVTLTSGFVSGFSKQDGVRSRRAWVKTDATIAGGNSGGTAIDAKGRLVAIPTQAAAGTGITPVDARPVVDTNRDGRVDQRDTPMTIGGFINGLRPVNLAHPLLKKVGFSSAGAGASKPASRKAPAKKPAAKRSSRRKASGAAFSTLLFSAKVTRDGRPINPTELMLSGLKTVYAAFDYDGMKNGERWGQVWAVNGKSVVNETDARWDDGEQGRKVLKLSNAKGLPDGEYHLVLTLGKAVVAEGKLNIGRREEDTDTEISGQIVDADRGAPIAGATVMALRPDVSAQQFIAKPDRRMAVTMAKTGRDGTFTLPEQLGKGYAYGLVVIADGYRDVAIDGALRISANAPERARINAVQLRRD